MKALNKAFFVRRNTLAVAKNLLGKVLVRRYRGKIRAYVITEVEAYDGPQDKASHAYPVRSALLRKYNKIETRRREYMQASNGAYRGKTARNAPMFGEAGCWYVYFVYGMYWMLNIVTGPKKYPAAILIRGAILINKPMVSCHVHELRNSTEALFLQCLASATGASTRNSPAGEYPCTAKIMPMESFFIGPGKLTRALNIDKKFNGMPANKKTGLWIEDWGINVPPRAIRKVPRVGVSYAKEWAQKPYRFVIDPVVRE